MSESKKPTVPVLMYTIIAIFVGRALVDMWPDWKLAHIQVLKDGILAVSLGVTLWGYSIWVWKKKHEVGSAT